MEILLDIVISTSSCVIYTEMNNLSYSTNKYSSCVIMSHMLVCNCYTTGTRKLMALLYYYAK